MKLSDTFTKDHKTEKQKGNFFHWYEISELFNMQV